MYHVLNNIFSWICRECELGSSRALRKCIICICSGRSQMYTRFTERISFRIYRRSERSEYEYCKSTWKRTREKQRTESIWRKRGREYGCGAETVRKKRMWKICVDSAKGVKNSCEKYTETMHEACLENVVKMQASLGRYKRMERMWRGYGNVREWYGDDYAKNRKAT